MVGDARGQRPRNAALHGGTALPLVWLLFATTWGRVTLRSGYVIGYVLICGITGIGVLTTTAQYESMEQQGHAGAAQWIRAHIPADATLMVVVDAGLVPLMTDLRTIDVGALNDRYLAHERDALKRINYLFDQRAAVVLVANETGIVAAQATRNALLGDPRWATTYTLAEIGIRTNYRDYALEIWVRNGTSLR